MEVVGELICVVVTLMILFTTGDYGSGGATRMVAPASSLSLRRITSSSAVCNMYNRKASVRGLRLVSSRKSALSIFVSSRRPSVILNNLLTNSHVTLVNCGTRSKRVVTRGVVGLASLLNG